MKNMHKKIKFITLTFIFSLVVIFSSVHEAQADNYWAGVNNDVFVTVNLDHGSNYIVDSPFRVSGTITYPYGSTNYKVDMSVIAGGIFESLLSPQTLIGSLFASVDIIGATDDSHLGTNTTNFTVGVDEEEPVIIPPSGECKAYLKFSGQFRRGQVNYIGPTPTKHPSFTIDVTLVGYVAPQPGTMTGEKRLVMNQFIIPENSLISSWGGGICSGISGCEIEGTRGFDHGYVSSVTPSIIPGVGKVCVESEPAIPPGCRFENDAPGVCWRKASGMSCTAYLDGSGNPAENC